MIVIAASALLKLGDLPAFEDALRTWQSIPNWAHGALVVLVPTAELTIACVWLVGTSWSRSARYAAMGLLLAWTGTYLVETVLWGPPTCGCFGRVQAWQALRNEAPWVAGRNIVLICLLAAGSEFPRRSARSPGLPETAPRSRLNAPGFTLIETVLVVALVGLLIALVIPNVAGVRRRAASVQALADLRTHAATAMMYSSDFNGSFICTLDPAATHTVVTLPGTDERTLLPYFSQVFYWWAGVADGYYGGEAASPSFYPPNPHGSGRFVSPYFYTASGLARPEYWRYETRSPLGQIGPMRITDVSFPDRKAMFINLSVQSARGRVTRRFSPAPPELSCCDGSALVPRADRLVPPLGDGDGPWGWPYAIQHIGDFGVHTPNGVRGSDLR